MSKQNYIQLGHAKDKIISANLSINTDELNLNLTPLRGDQINAKLTLPIPHDVDLGMIRADIADADMTASANIDEKGYLKVYPAIRMITELPNADFGDVEALKYLFKTSDGVFVVNNIEQSKFFSFARSSDSASVSVENATPDLELTLPSQYDGVPVTSASISSYMNNNSKFKKIIIPNSINVILHVDANSNYGFTRIEADEFDFSNNQVLTSFNQGSFWNPQITNFKCPSNIDSIFSDAFRQGYITNLYIPKSLTRLEVQTSTTISNIYVEDLQSWLNIFNSTDSNFNISSSRTKLYAQDKITKNYKLITELKASDFPEKCTNMPKRGIPYNTTKVELPESITIIPHSCFYADQVSKYILKLPNTLESIEAYAFQNSQITLASPQLPESLKIIERQAFQTSKIHKIILPDSYPYIHSWAFYEADLELTIQDAVKYIESRSNPYCYLYKYIGNMDDINPKLPDSVIYVGHRAFENSKILDLTLPASVRYIQIAAFMGSSIQHLVASRDLKEIEGSSFRNCQSLEYIDFTKCAAIPKALPGAFIDINPACEFQVPITDIDAWKAAPVFSEVASQIVGI